MMPACGLNRPVRPRCVQHGAVTSNPPGPGSEQRRHEPARAIARVGLAALLTFTGSAHLVNPEPFTAQVPPWFPAPSATILVSGVVELVLAVALLVARDRRPLVGWVVAGFFVVIFPGNLSQLVTRTSAFGLDSDQARFIRLLFQPVLIVWALWCTGAWRNWRDRRGAQSRPRTSPPPS